MDLLTPDVATSILHQTIPATGRLGIVVEGIGPGEVTLRLPLEGNANHFGTMYAGALFSLTELPGGLIPLVVLGPGRYTPIAVDMHVRYLAPARSDVTLIARMDPDEVQALAQQADDDGSAPFALGLTGVDEHGRAVVATQGNYQLRPARR